MGCLVTGIGYIGSRLVEMLLDSGETVVGLDNLFSTDSSALDRLAQRPGFTLIRGDVTDAATVRRAFESGVTIETVYHLAAQASANPTAATTHYTEETNLVGPRVVLEQACAAGTRTFVFGSSFQIYGRRPEGRVEESHPFGPILDIAHLSKVYVEKLMEMFSHNRGLRCIAARLGLVYGMSPVMKTDPRFMTAPNKFCRQVALGEPIRVEGSGLYPTSLIHVEDAARGLMALARWPQEGFTPVNLLGESASIARVAELVESLAVQRGIAVQIDRPSQETAEVECSFESAMSRIGFAPRISLEEGLAAVLDHFLCQSPHPDPLPKGEGKTASPRGRGRTSGARAGEGPGTGQQVVSHRNSPHPDPLPKGEGEDRLPLPRGEGEGATL